MITEIEKKTICQIAKKYHIKKVLLFGSCIIPNKKSNDIDIAIDGISEQDFFKFYGDLLFSLSKPVDVIDLFGTSKFISLIKKEGIILYG